MRRNPSARLALLLVGAFAALGLHAQAAGKTADNPRDRIAGTLPAATPIELQLETHLNTRDLKYGDGFAARVLKPVYYQGVLAIPADSILEGKVLLVRDRRPALGNSELMLRPDLISLPGGERYVISAALLSNDPLDKARVDAEGTLVEPRGVMSSDLRRGEIAGGAGLVAGALLSGAEGALVGGGVGAAVAAGFWLTAVRHVDLKPGTRFTVRLDRPLQMRAAVDTAAPAPSASDAAPARADH